MEVFKKRLDNHLVRTAKGSGFKKLSVSTDPTLTILEKIFWVVLAATVWFRLLLAGMTFKKSDG